MSQNPTDYKSDLDTLNIAKDLNDYASKNAPEFRFGSAEIVGASKQHAHLFSNTVESAIALTPTAGQAVTGGMAVALATGSGLAGAAVAAGLTIRSVFKGSGGRGQG